MTISGRAAPTDHDHGHDEPEHHGHPHLDEGEQGHAHGRPRESSDDHDHERRPDRGHEHRHDHDPDHGHSHNHGDDDGHSHADDDGHSHDDDHGHGHGDDDGHGHEHGRGGLWAELRHLLASHSHDAADSIDSALVGSRAGIRAVQLSLIGLAVTAVLQLIVALASGSVAVLADTIHNFADASTAIPLWLAFWIGDRPPNSRYTYGYGRAEDLAGVFVLLMIVGSAAVALWESLLKLLRPTPVEHVGWVAAAGLLGFLGNEVVAQYRLRVGQRIGSAALVADGYHARTDGLTSLAVLIGAAGVWLGFPIADPLVGLLITVAIVLVLKDAAVQMWRRLMDAVDPGLVAAATAAAASAEGVERVSAVRARWIGHSIHAEALIVADGDLSLDEAHTVAERARHEMLHAVPRLASVTVHVDPSERPGIDAHADLAHHDRRS